MRLRACSALVPYALGPQRPTIAAMRRDRSDDSWNLGIDGLLGSPSLERWYTMQPNSLYFGDNLKVLSEQMPDGTFRFPSESVDLIYLDPPFNSNRNYNLIFKETSSPPGRFECLSSAR